jgi:hypothetical protein
MPNTLSECVTSFHVLRYSFVISESSKLDGLTYIISPLRLEGQIDDLKVQEI